MRFKCSCVAFIISCVIFSFIFIKSINLEQGCTGYLKRSADANTVELASRELNRSIEYLENNRLTKDYTSVLYRTPDEDIEFWYLNLKECQDELSKVDSTTTQLEKTNLLMKLRETLTDEGERGTKLTVPEGLSRYPYNTMLAIFMIIGVLGTLWFAIEILIKRN